MATQQSDYITKLNTYVDALETGIEGVGGDIKAAYDIIKQMQASAGTFTPEDQASADKLEARLAAATSKLSALDSENPPPAPQPSPTV